ncbi:MAG: hypothetical protein WC856_26510 [Methylococcaceae bacterium]
MADIARAATRRADALTGSDKVDKKPDGSKKADETPPLKRDVGLEEAVDKRTDILVKHRGQIVELDSMQDAAKALFNEAMEVRITADNAFDDKAVKAAKNLFWQAKIAADILKDHCAAIKIKHGAERTAWGMDALDLSPNDLESFTDQELDFFALTGKIPQRFKKIFRGYDD